MPQFGPEVRRNAGLRGLTRMAPFLHRTGAQQHELRGRVVQRKLQRGRFDRHTVPVAHGLQLQGLVNQGLLLGPELHGDVIGDEHGW